ncbi:MAG: hypothetical protein ACF8R7_16810 [Phycisphaerales bacterium JB039]
MAASTRAAGAWTAPVVAGAVVLVILGPAILWPVAWAAAQIGAGLARDGLGAADGPGLSPRSLAMTLGVALLIGALAAALALPVAWVIGRRGRWVGLLMAPLLLPSYLVYSAWDLLRAPGSSLGDWLAAGPAWRSVWAGYLMAVGGMALWAWPIAAIPLAAGVRHLGAGPLEASRLEMRSGVRAGALIISQLRRPILCAVALVTLVALGSAVPLHLAQVPTYAIELWRMLDETPAAQAWRIWLASWPLVLIAAAGAALLVAVAHRAEGSHRPLAHEPSAGLGPRLGAWLIWAMATLVPLGLLIRVTSPAAIGRFLEEMRAPIVSSGLVACGVGGAAALLAGAIAALASGGARARAVALGAVAMTGGAALLPGALIGSITLRAWSGAGALAPVADSPLIVILAHLMRFGIVASLAGWWLGRMEPRQLAELRALEGAGLWGWLRSAAVPMLPGLLGAGLCCSALSFHEIEAAVIVAPPALGQSFPGAMLDYLHRTYLERLGAGAVLLMLAGLGAGGVSATIASRQFLPRLNRRAPDPHNSHG